MFVSQVLTGDFAGAWNTVKEIAQAVMNGIITVYNNTIGLLPGVSKIDMVSFADNVKIAEDAMVDTATQAGVTADAIRETGTAATETAQVVRDAAAEVLEAERQLTADWAVERKSVYKMPSTRWLMKRLPVDAATAAEAQALKDRKDATKKYHEDQHKADLAAWEITEGEYKLAQVRLRDVSAAKYADLRTQAEEFGTDDLALVLANNVNIERAVRDGANDTKEIFRLAHDFINAHADTAFARYVEIMKKHLADGVISAEQAAADIAEALGRAQGAAAGSGLKPGEGRDLNSPGGGSSKGGLTAPEAASRLKSKAVGQWIDDPYSNHIWAKMREPFPGARASQWVTRFANPAALAAFIGSVGGSLAPAAQHVAFVNARSKGRWSELLQV